MNNWSLSFEPLLPWLVIAVLAVPALLLVAYAVMARSRGAGIRALAAAALTLALVNPVLLREDRIPQETTVAVIVDESQSQRLQDRSGTTADALEQLQQSFARFPQFDLRIATAGRADNANENTSTELFGAMRQVLRDVPPARVGGAIFITDGQVHDVPEDLADLGFNAPLHALITGQPDEFDRRIEMIQSPRFSIINQPLTMNYRVLEQGTGGDPQATLSVELRRNGELLSTELVTPGEDFPVTFELDRAGKNIVELSVEVADNEVTENNNRAVIEVEGIRENLRVLLVSGEPHSGERTWRNLLKSDASVDLVHFTILRPPEKQDGTPINELSLIAFPTRELFVEKIEDFDLIIFDRYQNRNVLPVLYYDYIAQYVRNGGALLIAAGPEFAGNESIARTPLVEALPALPTGAVRKAAYRPTVTDIGARHPVTRDLPGNTSEGPEWGRWFRTIDVGNTEGEVVMNGADDQPLLILERFGEGRVGLMLSDHGWLWARGFEGGGPHVALYRRTAHWLMREPDLEEETLSAEGDGQRLEITRQTMADEAGEAMVTTPSGEERAVTLVEDEPGLFKGTLETAEIGLFTITNGELTALASVGPVDAPEFRDMISTTDVLAETATSTGGTARRLITDRGNLTVPNVVPVRSQTGASGRDWVGIMTTEDTQLVGVERRALFSGFLGLALLLMALAGTWWREGR